MKKKQCSTNEKKKTKKINRLFIFSRTLSSNKRTLFPADDAYLAKPVVKANPTKPVKTGQVSLTCDTKEEGVTYSWSTKGQPIVDQVDKTIQYGDIDANTDGDYKCAISKDGFTSDESDAFTLAAGGRKHHYNHFDVLRT